MSYKRFLALVLVFPFSAAFAQSVAPSTPGPTSFAVSTVRNITTFNPTTVSPANVGRYAFAHAIGGNVVADAATGFPLPDGRTVPVVVRGNVSKAATSAAIGKFLRKGLPFVGTGVALFDLAKELGYDLSSNGGQIEITQPEVQHPTYTDAYEYSYGGGPWSLSIMPACNAWIAAFSGGQFTWGAPTYVAPQSCRADRTTTSNGGTFPITQSMTRRGRTSNPLPPQQLPVTPQQFEDAVAAKNDWQPSSALARSLLGAIMSGELVQPAPESVTGPASTPGESSTEVDEVNGTTTTTTNTFNHIYEGATVTTTNNTTKLTIDNSTGATISNTTTTGKPVMPESKPEDEGTPTDTALPGQPELYEPEYPEGLKGVWDAKKAQLQDVPLLNLLDDLMPTVSGSGSCPSWTIDLDMYIADYGSHTILVPCWVWDFGKVVIICSALLLSRRLIFGG